MIALPLGLFLAAVALLYRWLRAPGWSRGDRLRWALAWGPALAFGLPSCALFAARWCGLDGALPWSLATGGALAAGGLALRRRRSAALVPSAVDAPGAAGEFSPPTGARGAGRALALRGTSAALLAITFVLLLGTFRTWQRAQPAGMWDAVAIWNSSARFLARAEADRLPALFSAQTEGHPGYPLFLSAAVAAQWAVAEDESSAVPLGMSFCLALGLAAALHLAVRLCGAPLFAGPSVLLVFSTPIVWKWAFAQVADLPLAYLALAGALPLVVVLQDQARSAPPAVVSGFILGLLPWTKDEGALVAAALLGLFVGLAWLHGLLRPDRRRQILPFLLGTLPGVGALVLFKLTWAPAVPARASFLRGAAAWAQLVDFDRWHLVAAATLRHLDPRTGDALWGFAWPLLGLGLLFWGGGLRWRAAPGAVLLAGAAAMIFMSYVFALVLSPYDLAWHVASALDRLLLHVLPLLAAAVFGLAGADTSNAQRAPPAR